MKVVMKFGQNGPEEIFEDVTIDPNGSMVMDLSQQQDAPISGEVTMDNGQVFDLCMVCYRGVVADDECQNKVCKSNVHQEE